MPPRPLRAGILLSRNPIVTKEPSAFVKAFYHYQDELERRLMWTFPWYFYFKRGTLSQRKFDSLQKGPMPRHKDVYYPEGIPDVKHNRERRSKQVVNLPSQSGDGEGDKIIPKSRTTPADEKKDIKALDRKLDSTLYLVVNNKEWRLPSFEVSEEATSLHEAAEAGLRELGGSNINTWTVSNTPAAVIKGDVPEFVIKSHILHGQFAPKNLDFAWLTKEEIKEKVKPEYFTSVEALL